MKTKTLLWIILPALCLLLVGCGGQPAAVTEPTVAPTAEPTPEPTPETPPELLLFPTGDSWYDNESAVDLSEVTPDQLEECIALLQRMPQLRDVDLGSQGSEAEPRLSYADVRRVQEAVPQAAVLYRFHFMGRYYTTLDEILDLNHLTMYDEGAAVRELLPIMTACTYLDMDSCGVSSEAMAAIRDENPQMEVVWRIWFGLHSSVRTDAERIFASNGGPGLTNENTVDLQYCTKVKYIDIGHNTSLTDLSFVRYMPDLEVAVIAISPWRDLSPLAECTNLEFLECSEFFLQQGEVIDLAPLGNLVNLKHLNICKTFHVENYEALANLTGLERLWIGAYCDIPEEGIEMLREALPDTEINTTEQTGSLGTWRYDEYGNKLPRYELLCEQFDYEHVTASDSTYYNDPRYYYSGYVGMERDDGA